MSTVNNEVYKGDKSKSPKPPYRTLNMNTYTHDIMPDEIRAFQAGGLIKSGYDNLDALTNLYPGFYVLGAISSLGKTTFTHQLGDQLAAAGHHVLFFSMEQSALELASKSLSRILAKEDASTALTSLEIRKNKNPDLIREAVNKYAVFSGKMTIIECSFSMTIDDIEKYVNNYIKQNSIKPIVIIDYLQVIQASADSYRGTKDIVDTNVRRLKILQDNNQLVLIAISSLNRQNYLTQIDFESFKESGGIEYTADVVWGLQLQVLRTNDVFKKPNALNEKREAVRKAKAKDIRDIDLICIKNRFGISSYLCCFNYYPKFDLFKPDMSDDEWFFTP